MANPTQPNIKLVNLPDYRENYANSVQVRVSVWDFFLVFGTMQQPSETQVEVQNFQGVYLSPQQAKALVNILQQGRVVNWNGTKLTTSFVNKSQLTASVPASEITSAGTV